MRMGIKSISSAFHLSRNTVRKYQESGLRLEQMLSMSEDKLQDLFLDGKNCSRVPSSRRLELDALIPDYVKRLSKKGVTIKSLHEEYQKGLQMVISTLSSNWPSVPTSVRYVP